ncbi:MAG: HAD family phosphatase, partial [Gammaproteobacteria bacterium]
EIYVSFTIGLRKPDQAAFEWVADAMQLSPEEILFLDDNPENVAGAIRSGLTTVQTRGEAEVLAALAAFEDRLGR